MMMQAYISNSGNKVKNHFTRRGHMPLLFEQTSWYTGADDSGRWSRPLFSGAGLADNGFPGPGQGKIMVPEHHSSHRPVGSPLVCQRFQIFHGMAISDFLDALEGT